jgi:large subunit ribosomal protein L21
MYAIIEDSGQQFKVSEGDVLRVDLRDLAEDAKDIEFGRVLLLAEEGNVRVGRPLVDGAKVQAEILDPLAKGEKVHAEALPQQGRPPAEVHRGPRDEDRGLGRHIALLAVYNVCGRFRLLV